jgi:hypothetical protein
MLLFRWLVLLLLLGAGVSFAFYAGTGQERFKRYGLLILKWTVLSALGFFAVLILERVA